MSNKQVYPAPVQPSLPQGWQLYVDGQGRPFYWNHFTKQSSWTPPPVAQPQPQQFPQPNYYPPAPTSSNIASNNLPPGWEQSVDNEGRTYYIDHKNKTTSWHPPQTQTASGSSNPYQSISSTVAAPQSVAPQPMSTMYPMSVPMPMPIQPSVLPSQPNQFYGSPPLASSGIAMGTSPSGSSSWQQNYGMSGYVNPVNVPLLCCSKPSWDTNKEETHCSRCNLEFTFFKRRHHCRCCFRGYCDTCSTKRSAVPQFGHTAAQRVCDSCFGHLSRKENECVSRLIPYMFLVTPSLTNTATSTNAISAIPTLPKELPQAIKEILQLVVAHQHSQTLAKAFNDDILSSNCIPPIVDLLQNHLSRLSQEEIEQLFAIVSHLSTDNALLDSLITTNCLPAVVNILKKSTQDANNLTITTDLRTKGCTFLRNIAVVEKYRETLRQSRAIEVIIDCIGCATGEAIELGQISSHAVNLLTSPGNANSEQTISNNDMLLYIGQLSNATTNMLVLLSSSHDIKTLQYITESLSNLATIEKNKDTMEDLGVVMTLISLLSSKESKRPIEIPAILINVLKCVFELTRKLNNTSCDTLAQSHEAMESLLTLFNTLDDDLILLNVNILTNLERFCNAGNRRTVSNILLSGVNLSAMLKFAESHNLQLQIAALELIATATSNVEAQSSSLDNIRNSGGIQCLVRIISSAPTYLHQTSSQTPSQPGILSQGQSYEHIVYIALQLTCRLVESNLQNAVTLLEVGGVSILADLMLDTNLVESIRVQILFVLCATSKYGNLVEVMPLSGNMQFMQILSQLMKHNSVEIVLSVLNLLCNMAILQDNRLAIHKSGCMNNIVGLLDISNEPIQLGCLTLITSLCSSVGQAPDDVVRDSMAELGVIAPIVSLLRSSNSNIEKQAALALKHACRSYVNREHIIAIGALSPLTKLLANESLKNIESRVHLAEILAAFSAEEKARTVMKESDGISIFIELLFSQDDPLQLNATIALSNFALSQADADVIHKNGGALAIMGLIDKAHSVGIQESAILALGNLASHSQCREDIVQAIVSQADSGSQMNAIKYLLFLMTATATQSEQSDLVSVQLRPRAIWCLSMLSMNESLANYLSLIYAMPLVGQALLACADVNTTEYQQLVFIILNLCRNNDTNWNTLVETGGVPLLLLLCQNNIWEAQIKSLNSLASLSQRQDSQEQILTSSVGISTLVSMLKSPNDAIKSSAIVIFSNISHFQQAWKVLNDNIGDIVGALSSKEPVVQFSVSVVLKNLASHTDNWKHIIDCGAVPRLIELLFNSEERLQIVTVEILCSLSNDETIANLIHSYGGVLALITLLSAPNDTLKEIVTLTLANLCKVSAICCDTVITNDGLEPIIPLLSSPNNKLQVNALFIVGKLSSNPNFCNLIEIHGGLPPLLALIRPSQPDESTGSRKPFGDVESQVLDTLLNISVHSEKNRQAIVGAGGLPILLGLVEPPSLDPFQTIPFAITALVLNVLANLVMDDFTKRAVRELEGISRITQTFLSFSAKTSSTDSAKDVLAILQQALRAMYFLSIDDSNCAVICPVALQAVTGLLRETTSRDLIIQSLKLCKVFGAYASNHTAIQNTELIGGVVIPLISSTSLDDRDTQFHLIDLLSDLAFLDSAQNGEVLRAYGGLQAVAHTLTSQHEDVVVPSLMLLSRLVIQDANRKIVRDVLEPQVLVVHCSSVSTLVKRLACNLKQTLFG